MQPAIAYTFLTSAHLTACLHELAIQTIPLRTLAQVYLTWCACMFTKAKSIPGLFWNGACKSIQEPKCVAGAGRY